jgi:excisionase family DNA binding protein
MTFKRLAKTADPNPITVAAQESIVAVTPPRTGVATTNQIRLAPRLQAVSPNTVCARRRLLGPKRGLSREEAAEYLGISPSKFDQLRKDGRIGPPRLIDGRKVWDIRELDRDFEAFPIEGEQEDEDWSTSV